MSIRTNKMKAVAVLMKQLTKAKNEFHEKGRDESFEKKLEKLRLDLNRIKDVFVEVKKNEEKLLDTLAEVYVHLHRLDRKKLDEDMEGICKRIRDSAHNLLPTLVFDDSYKEEDDRGSPQQLVQPPQRQSLTAGDVNIPDDQLYYFLCLLIFPENAIIRKGIAINLWIAEGLITEKETADELGEDVVHKLLELKVIVRYGSTNDPLVNKFQIPHDIRSQFKFYLDRDLKSIRPRHLLLYRKKFTIGGIDTKNVTSFNIFNIGTSYLNFGPQWVTDSFKNIEVLQLGRWQDSPIHHIEVGSEEFLKELIKLKGLKYLSLRGISRIFKLPSSVAKLESLLILDLKACHNLETLPDDISSMKSLTHLIMSDCCLLEAMPKGIEKLTNLQVLKGFLITTSEKTPCTVSDLANNLTNLRRLSIRIGSEAVSRDFVFPSLQNFPSLKHLKISWSVSDPRSLKFFIHWPVSLRKLHLECFHGKSLLEFLPRGYEILDELNITGGKLENIFLDTRWRVKILRLKYLKQLNVDTDDLKISFPFLQYLEIKQISNHSYIERTYE
ncbi:hypothetical protein LR48_Vigan03g053800 [Vigna angularis]|uniref:Rx N-terminal domain-containing protein n=2 Tax=Phaseolus angularis TaxID=3914 RepID=A0A0L9U3B2_PHAAN|nr:disease resistance RPP13-like protein 4 [Vigna angularis]KAG2404352.1 uncharacterized protein HKW66_Vig0112740 [Vigna angularis]KOM37157.1 hypothetical protein LR48_Vigan03g053800 [Vigna angularis]BAT83657.1 hypothetical protein VIGAN_04084400 [Vigna angularis var. angularis]